MTNLFIAQIQKNYPSLVTPFYSTIAAIADVLGVKPEWLLLILNSESGLNPKAVTLLPASVPGYNERGQLVKPAGTPDDPDPVKRCVYRATGLNQLMPATSHGLGTSNQAVFNENIVEQLAHVKAFYLPVAGKIKSFKDLYLWNFMPSMVGKPLDTVLPAFVEASNRGLDINGDGKLTIAEFEQAALMHVPAVYKMYL